MAARIQRAVLLLALTSALGEEPTSTPITIKQRKTRVIREPVPIRGPSNFKGGVLADKLTRTSPVNRWYNFDGESGDFSMWYFQNITHKSQTKKNLLGMWKGYEGDHQKNVYRSIIFDDGDICRANPERRYAVVVELSRKDYSSVHDYFESFDLVPGDPCTFKTKINFHAKEPMMQLPPAVNGLVEGIVQWWEDPNSPHLLCREVKCEYGVASAKIDEAVRQIDGLKAQLKDLLRASNHNDALGGLLQSSSSIVTAANEIMSHSMHVYDQLTLFQSLAPPNCPTPDPTIIASDDDDDATI
ncbi:Aste57867_41 [Aphanomyces stellatus]|uniref:Aste57867_41 protein n=1 Tax=Aphanomyces stellatus TaxID=120398 RepID=A0A485K2T6_9STRA|nr:hypothetical protein As57867_000041 [Aphanomyces stellatus]VFT77267.1 Aste57867_41 [Aphanomyces stellatus]